MGLFPFHQTPRPASDQATEARGPVARLKKFRFHPLWALAALGLLLLAATGCSYTDPQTTFDARGPVSRQLLVLTDFLIWVMAAVFIAVEGALLYTIIKFRRRPGQGLPPQTHGHPILEIAWTIVPTLLIMAVGVWTVIVLFQLDRPPATAAVTSLDVKAIGHQWWFEFEYPDANGKAISAANELRVPVGRVVNVELHSDDVIHSFWVPKLAGKVDMIPTRVNRLWFVAEEPGMYYGQCAEFCGLAHAQMKFRVIAMTQSDFDAWVAGYGQAPTLSESAQRGQALFVANCSMCHTATGADTRQVMEARMDAFIAGSAIAPGPNLTDLATRHTLGAGLIELNPENLRRWITNPDDIKPGNSMADRAFIYNNPDGSRRDQVSLTNEQVNDLVDYLLSLK